MQQLEICSIIYVANKISWQSIDLTSNVKVAGLNSLMGHTFYIANFIQIVF